VADNTSSDTAGTRLTLAVLRPVSGGSYTIVGADTETLPSPLPASGVATFPLATPIVAASGDVLALYSSDETSLASPTCYFGGAGPSANSLNALNEPSPPSAGQTLTPDPGVGPSPPSFELDVAATVVQRQDAGVTTAAEPSGAAAGRPALLSSTVSNAGPSTNPITFVDHVPAGMTINSAVAGQGTCSTSAQTVTCTISGLAAGHAVPVDVVVTPAAAGNYANTVSVAVSGATDPNAADNNASATLAVGPPAPNPTCVVPKLRNTPARVAKTVLIDLGCTVTESKKHSKSVHKGLVIQTKPGAGTYPFRMLVNLTASSGRKKAKKHEVRHALAHRSWLIR
jgi:hypothetical protein